MEKIFYKDFNNLITSDFSPLFNTTIINRITTILITILIVYFLINDFRLLIFTSFILLFVLYFKNKEIDDIPTEEVLQNDEGLTIEEKDGLDPKDAKFYNDTIDFYGRFTDVMVPEETILKNLTRNRYSNYSTYYKSPRVIAECANCKPSNCCPTFPSSSNDY